MAISAGCTERNIHWWKLGNALKTATSSTIHITHEHQKFVAVKGNPTEVLELCSQQMKDGSGASN